MIKHTPGPWKETNAYDIRFPCGLVSKIYWPVIMPDDERQANTRLIAAAPDLLEALKAIADDWCFEWCVAVDSHDSHRDRCDQIRKALALVEGKDTK